MAQKKNAGGGIASLVRQAGQQAKLTIRHNEEEKNAENELLQSMLVEGPEGAAPASVYRPPQPRIFSVLEYIESSWGLGMKLFPVQRFIVKLYYHLPLEDRLKTITVSDMFNSKVLYNFTEVEYLRYLFNEGRCNIGVQDHERRLLILPIGRRAGKTTMSSIFASYEVYRLLNLHNPQGYYGLPNGNRIQILSVATDKDQAGILFNEVTTHLARCEYFKPYIANNTLSHIQFRTPYDIERYGDSFRHSQDGKFTSLNGKATLRVTFKSCVAKGLRGSGNVVIILDEMAHFQDKGNSSAKEIYDAVTPSAAAFSPKHPETGLPAGPVESRIICISSPLNRSGKFFELYDQAMHGGPGAENMLAIQGPTWEVNPTLPASYYRQKYHEDPAVFMTEHGAQFSDRVRVWIEREADLMACVDPDHRPSFRGAPREPHQMGVDVALVNDGSSVSITKVEGEHIVHVYHEVWYAGVDWREANPHLGEAYPTPYARQLKDVDRLDFEEIANWIEALSKRFYITDGVFDRWSGLPLEQGLAKRGLKQFKSDFFTRDQSSRMYQATKLLMFDQKLRLYDWPKVGEQTKHSPFINELLMLQAEQVSKNVILVHKSESVGAKDDQSDAFSRAVWLSYQRLERHKHIGGAHTAGGPVLARGSGVAAYQLARARKHGGFTERTVLRNLGFRGRGR